MQSEESGRLEALAGYFLAPDALQDDLEPTLQLIGKLYEVQTVLISIVEEHRQVFAARMGIAVCATDRNVSFCSHAIIQDEVMVVLDASLDAKFNDNPLVTGLFNLRFYAGAPLRTVSGHVLGTLCLIDNQPRQQFSDRDRDRLRAFADLVVRSIELRKLEIMGRANRNRFLNIAATSPDAIVCTDGEGAITFWNAGAVKLFGFFVEEALGRPIDIIIPEATRARHAAGMVRLRSGGVATLVGKTIELLAQRKDGAEIPVELSLSTWSDDGQVSFGSIVRDVSERKTYERQLIESALIDPLTGVRNRLALRDSLNNTLASKQDGTLLMVDLDGFKHVNDALGHGIGDKVLCEAVGRICARVNSAESVHRMGGDEFALLLPAVNSGRSPEAVAAALLEDLAMPFYVDGSPIAMSASIGIARYPDHAESAEMLLANADIALYQAKADGRNRLHVFSPTLRTQALVKRQLEMELQIAVDGGQFELFFQPQYDLKPWRLLGFEALIRWRHPTRGLLTPASFLSVVEGGLIALKVGAWVIETACRQLALWREAGASDLRMGVNLSGKHFRAGDIVGLILKCLERNALPSDSLELEVTEDTVLDDSALDQLRTLRAFGVHIAFDDYGTGHASLSRLKQWPVTRLKIDQSFVRDMCSSPADAAIVKAVVTLAAALGLEVIAEGVEMKEQQDLLVEIGCSSVQGYLYGRPRSAAESFALLADHRLGITDSDACLSGHVVKIAEVAA